MIKTIWVIVLISGADSSTSLPQTKYSTKEACMNVVNDMLIGDWTFNYSSTEVQRRTTPTKYLYATCIPTEQ